MILLAMCAPPAHAAVTAQAQADLGLGWFEYAALWVGDPVLGGFDQYSPPQVLDRLLISPQATVTLRPGQSHRLRVRVNGRSLHRFTYLDDDGELAHGWASDGQPWAEAAAERLFLDEASWRWRPGGDRWLDARVGILPWSMAGGRLLAESWPAAHLRVDAARKGWAPASVELHASVTPQGSRTLAAGLYHEPSWLEYVGVEAAITEDHDRGIAPLIEQDMGLLLGLWGITSGDFYAQHQDWVDAGLYTLYGQELDGVRMLHQDLETYIDLDGWARVAHLAASGRVLVGHTLIDAALMHARGRVGLSGDHVPPDADPADMGGERWATDAPREPFQREFPVSGWAWDLAAEVLLHEHWRWTTFFQGMTGDRDMLQKAANGERVDLFLATDLAFVRTRIFPQDSTLDGGSWSFPPGVAGHGILTPGTSLDLLTDRVSAQVQVAVPLATDLPDVANPHGRLYGVEGDLLLAGEAGERTTLAAELGVFQPGTFFLLDGVREDVGDLPLGWRVHASLNTHLGGSR